MSHDELRIERTLSAPREVVFEAFTNPSSLTQWWGPEGSSVESCEVDLRVGGAWRIALLHGDGQVRLVGGVWKTIEQTQIAFTWRWEEESEETLVQISFESISDSATRLTLTQGQFNTQQDSASHNTGWSSSFRKLETYLERT